jgi:hypothetical protein
MRRLWRQFLILTKFHEQHHAFVCIIFRHLTNYKAVHHPLNVVALWWGIWAGKACVNDIVNLGGPKPDATRIPTQGPAIIRIKA